MRTEIQKTFKWGFLLSEQELRRLLQTCHDHASKTQDDAVTKVSVKLRDGAVIESPSIEDVLALENSGSRSVEKLSITVTENVTQPQWKLGVEFQDGLRNRKNWDSVSINVLGSSRDWAFVAGADLEERVKKTRSVAWGYLFSSRLVLLGVAYLGMILSTVTLAKFDRSSAIADELERLYATKVVTDPIQALITIERLKSAATFEHMFLPLFASVMAPLVVFGSLAFLLPRAFPSYNFYWGDYIAQLDRRRNIVKVFWTVVVLGIIVSVVANLLTKLF
jgi:hypothetical protein